MCRCISYNRYSYSCTVAQSIYMHTDQYSENRRKIYLLLDFSDILRLVVMKRRFLFNENLLNLFYNKPVNKVTFFKFLKKKNREFINLFSNLSILLIFSIDYRSACLSCTSLVII